MTRNVLPDLAEIVATGEGFRSRTFPGKDFHHREHLITTAYLLKSQPACDWRRELPAMIRRYNESQGGVNSETAGYHDTITMFYLDLVERIVAAVPDASLEGACAAVLQSPASDPNLMLRFYSRDRLFSAAARRTWVAPDLAAPDFDALGGVASVAASRVLTRDTAGCQGRSGLANSFKSHGPLTVR